VKAQREATLHVGPVFIRKLTFGPAKPNGCIGPQAAYQRDWVSNIVPVRHGWRRRPPGLI